jgi:hypothetical protein
MTFGMDLAMVYAFVSCLVIASGIASTALLLVAVTRDRVATRDERRARRLASKPGKHRAGRPPTAVAYGPLLAYGPVPDVDADLAEWEQELLDDWGREHATPAVESGL